MRVRSKYDVILSWLFTLYHFDYIFLQSNRIGKICMYGIFGQFIICGSTALPLKEKVGGTVKLTLDFSS